MPEKRRDVRPYWSLKQFVTIFKGSQRFEIVGKIKLKLDWFCKTKASAQQKPVAFKIVQEGQSNHDMIVKWKTAKKQGIRLEDHKKGAQLEVPFVATIPSAQLPKRSKKQMKKDKEKKKENGDKWTKAEKGREEQAKPKDHGHR